MSLNINCDMGESFGLYRMGDDEAIMPHIHPGQHRLWFPWLRSQSHAESVELAQRYGVKAGAHFSLPDLAGFGRREMKIEREEMANIIIYQIGALKGFLDVAGLALNHLKPHGALYGMAASQAPIAHAVADAAEHFRVPIFGLAGTLHEEVYTQRGLEFHAEFFSDLEYDDDGRLLITRRHEAVDPDLAAQRTVRAVSEGLVRSKGGVDLPVRAETVCVHSDTPNAAVVARTIRAALEPYLAA